jgi:hypothetical protein
VRRHSLETTRALVEVQPERGPEIVENHS